jgi:prophage maintenance system killer protein
MQNTGIIEFYESSDGNLQLDVKMQDETVWLSQEQMARLFDKNKRTISEHISNIFKEGELIESSVVRKFRTTASDGKKYNTQYYNLDVIISVGYRVKSKRGTQFRIWATNVLKGYIRQGYALDTKRLEQQNTDVKALMGLLENAMNQNSLASPEGQEMVKIIKDYASSFKLLLQYDQDELAELKGHKAKVELKIEEARSAIASLKSELFKTNEATDLFAKERGDAFAAIIGNIEQTFGGEPLYPTIESRAAHLLYFIIKDHPFSDGNKRSGAFMFMLYLSQNGLLSESKQINESGLVALTLLIAESQANQKDLMIKLIQNLIA